MSGQRLAARKLSAGLLVIGGAGVLEWAEVFGDGGSIVQLILGIVLFAAGVWSTVRWWNMD